jgi:outer membrane protein TolC
MPASPSRSSMKRSSLLLNPVSRLAVSAAVSSLLAPGLLTAGLLLGLSSCSAEGYVEEADAEVYEILGEKHGGALSSKDEAPEFNVDEPENTLRKELLERIANGEDVVLELDLARALEIAAENSEEFQQQKESLYFTALSLTSQRNRYSLIFSGGADAGVDGTADETAQGSVGGDLSVSRLAASGARILGGFVSNFFRVFTSGGGWDTSSLLSLSITQPLMEGFGSLVTMEPLTQAERNVVYAIRNFERFRRRFAVDVVAEYLAVIESRNSLQNAEANLQSLEQNTRRSEELAKAGRTPQFEVDQSKQRELSARNNVITSRTRLEAQLDRFKISLGLPIECTLNLAEDALDNARELGIVELALSEEKAIELAMRQRFDLRNSIEQIEDAERQVEVAKDALRIGLDLSAAISVDNEDDKKPFKFDWDNYEWEVGLTLDLPLNRVDQRNNYRRALIGLVAERRAHDRFIDSIKQGVRSQLRNVNQALRSYRIEENAVKLAEQRVDSTRLLIDAGRATTRDFLDAEQSLLSAKNNLTSRLVDYFEANLELLRELEMLDVGKEGLKVDTTIIKTFRADATESEASSEGEAPEPVDR